MRYGIKITGTIKLFVKESKSGNTYYQCCLASNNDYRTKQKLSIYSMVRFIDKDVIDSLRDGDIIEIIGRMELSYNSYKQNTDINLIVEKVLGVNGGNNVETTDEYDAYEPIETLDE